MNYNKPNVTYCAKCTVPSSSAVPIEFNDKGICSACSTSNESNEIDWGRRENFFIQLVEEYKAVASGDYDCIIPVSGGKDSYWQVHIALKFGLKPLLVTYNGNNYSSVGLDNLKNMRDVFGVDHIFYTPGVETLKKLNRLGQRMMGDMNWHAHAGIFTYPIQVAVEKKIPLMLWGEHGFMDLGGMHSYKDMVEFTYRYRHEHCLRGYEWYDFIESASNFDEILSEREMSAWKYPSDESIEEVGVRGVFISNFFKWDANIHGPLMQELYGFKGSDIPFERTYRKLSNLDDIHENGIHDYMKWIKFGYGRATDHTSKDVRSNKITRESAISEVLARDHVKSTDLNRWLEYVGWTEDEFDKVADRFRDPRVWWICNGEWIKKDIDDVNRSYGKVNLSNNDQQKYFIE